MGLEHGAMSVQSKFPQRFQDFEALDEGAAWLRVESLRLDLCTRLCLEGYGQTEGLEVKLGPGNLPGYRK